MNRPTGAGRSSGERLSLIDTLQSPSTALSLAAAISALPKYEKLVIALRYDEDLTLPEIGEVCGVSEVRVTQLHTKDLAQLRVSCSQRVLCSGEMNPP